MKIFQYYAYSCIIVFIVWVSYIYSGTSMINEPLYNEVLGKTNDFLHPGNSKLYEKEPRCNETNFASSLRFHFKWPVHLNVLNLGSTEISRELIK